MSGLALQSLLEVHVDDDRGHEPTQPGDPQPLPQSSLKQYVRDRFILCTETATNNISTDYSSGKAVDNLLNYGRRLSAITDRYLNG